MGYLHHKGYNGSVEYSDTDKCLYGKILGLRNSLILYEGNSLDELKADFMTGVESYIDRSAKNLLIGDGKTSDAKNMVLTK